MRFLRIPGGGHTATRQGAGSPRAVFDRLGVDCWSDARECSATHHRAGATEVDVESLHEPEGLRCQHGDSVRSAVPSGQTAVSGYGTPIHDVRHGPRHARTVVAWITPPA